MYLIYDLYEGNRLNINNCLFFSYHRELRDHGLTRPKVLIVVPFRDSALKIVEIFINLLMDQGEVRMA